MTVVFYVAAAIAVGSTAAVIVQLNAVHALLYLIVSLLAVAVIFFALGAPFVAALEVIIYAGAIMVLFLFVIMILNLGHEATAQESRWLSPKTWLGPGVLALVLVAEMVYVATRSTPDISGVHAVPPREVGMALFSTYLLGVELASILLLAGLVAAYHLGRREQVARGSPGQASEAVEPGGERSPGPVTPSLSRSSLGPSGEES
jgi:NADH-quinone oxidoreductase subunit J